MPRAYLGGTIEGVSHEVAEDWRAFSKTKLKQVGIDCFDPYTDNDQTGVVSHMPEIWSNNVQKITSSEIFLCKLYPTARNIGSIRELQIAVDLKKDVYVVDENLAETNNPSAWDLRVYHDLGDALLDIVIKWGQSEKENP